MQLNKIACTSKFCQWKKSRQRAEPAPFGEISFKRPKKHEVIPNVNSAGYKVNNLTGFSSLDLAETSYEFLKHKYFELRSFTLDAALFTSIVNQFHMRLLMSPVKMKQILPMGKKLMSVFFLYL